MLSGLFLSLFPSSFQVLLPLIDVVSGVCVLVIVNIVVAEPVIVEAYRESKETSFTE